MRTAHTKRTSAKAAGPVSILTGLACILAPASGECQEMPVPVREQATLFWKVVQFDRTIDARSNNGLVVGILFDEATPGSVLAKEEFAQALRTADLVDPSGRPPRTVEVRPGPTLGPTLESNHVDFLYVTPLSRPDVQSVVRETRRLGILSCSGLPDFARMGLGIAFDAQEGRPRFLINLSGAEAEGADFRPALLKMAEIIRRAPGP